MSTIYLLRHAQAENHSPSGLDMDRKLSAAGQHQANRAAHWLARAQPPPRLILASPAQRTRQTALAVHKALELTTDQLIWERAIYEATAGTLVSLLHTHWQSGPILLVGHNPGLETLLRLATQNSGKPWVGGMGTATIAHLSFAADSRILEQTAQLDALVRAESL